MNDDQLQYILNYDFTEIEKIPGQIGSIDENTKAILEELQKNNEDQQEFQSFLMTVEEEVPVEEVLLEEEVPVEEEVNYSQLFYEEMQFSNEMAEENQIAIIEHLQKIDENGNYSNETDGMLGLYLMWIVPFFVIILFFSKIINPFTRFWGGKVFFISFIFTLIMVFAGYAVFLHFVQKKFQQRQELMEENLFI